MRYLVPVQYNTGGMGEIIEVDKTTGKKKQVRKVTRVPIDLIIGTRYHHLTLLS
jgi:hypothetical protein